MRPSTHFSLLSLVLPFALAQRVEYTSWWTVRTTRTFGAPAGSQQTPSSNVNTQVPASIQTATAAAVNSVASVGSVGSAASTSAASASSTSTAKTSTGKKGVIYPVGTEGRVAALSPAWGCNWANIPKISDPSFEFVPQLWGEAQPPPGEDFPAEINAAAAPYSSVLFYNEPDICGNGGSCVDVTKAIPDWTSYMLPLQKQGKKVSTPCVSNGQGEPGGYMDTFLKAFPKGSIDILCFHWYGTCLSGDGCLQQTVEAFRSLQITYQIKELWLSEFGDRNSVAANIPGYINYLNGAPVDRWAYNLANLPVGTSL